MTEREKSRTAKSTTSKTNVPESAGRTAVEAAVRGERLDLVAAALIGAAVGAAAAMLAAGPTRRPIVRGVERGARRSRELAAASLDRVPAGEAVGALREYLESARSSIDQAVEEELRDLRRAVRRQRKRIGV